MFDLKDAAAQAPQKQYQTPGIFENVVITAVNQGEASTGSKYIQFETIGADGSIGKSPQMYLNNVANGDKPTAWSITARNLKNYLASTHNVSLDEAAEMIKGIGSVEDLKNKVSALLVGRKFRAKFMGVQTSKGFTIAELSGSESMQVPLAETKLKYDSVKDFKPYKGTLQTSQPTFAKTEVIDDLPF